MHRIFELLGLNHLKNSWPFIVIEIYVISSLGLVIMRRTLPVTRRNIGFFLNHFGLWLTLVTAGLGSGDLKRLSLELFVKGDYNNLASDGKREIYSLPFSMKLLDFQIYYYNPKIAIADSKSGEISRQHGEVLPLIAKGSQIQLEDWKINVRELIPYALKSDSGYYASNEQELLQLHMLLAHWRHNSRSLILKHRKSICLTFIFQSSSCIWLPLAIKGSTSPCCLEISPLFESAIANLWIIVVYLKIKLIS